MNENKMTVAELQEVFAHLGYPDFVEKMDVYDEERLEREREKYGYALRPLYVHFRGKEYKQLPEWFRNAYPVCNRNRRVCAAWVRMKKYVRTNYKGELEFCYVLSLKRFGVSIEIKSKDYQTAKELFIKAVNEAMPKYLPRF